MAYLAVMRDSDYHSDRNPRWMGDSHWNWNDGEQLKVFCYTNCLEAELFLNEKSLGTKEIQDADNYLSWDVAFREGELTVVAKGKDGKTYTHQLVTASSPKHIEMKADYPELKADGQDITHVEMQLTDENGTPVYLADNAIEVSIEGPGEIIGLESGNVRDLQPYSSHTRKAYNGKLVAFIRSTKEKGQIKVTAKSENQETNHVTITV